MIEFVEVRDVEYNKEKGPLNKEEFIEKVTKMLHKELTNVAEHLYDYVASLQARVDIEQLTKALIATHGKYASRHDQAAAIKALL